ncbi:CPBP family intramembrane glutamic endopeptidase [Georgenia yuyongxinii]|uniref:CPBP family intramembrane metalloprotease n=1 Tax=Georgenia yuyongxinii TaxID=2589797 RepID=A0A552WMT2_9MICO|nr:CPBP family intramembrane glutamic endopeptidase [Georgenia yuyongxinii]TRW44076.1 CPBP family intramembrane metalloprotease [Georgenia yuyongxinii]
MKAQPRKTMETTGSTRPTLRSFFLATFGLSWGAGALYVMFQDTLDGVFGPMGYTNPVFVLMVYAPGIVGVLLVWRHYGLSGLARFFRRFALWRMSMAWWLLLVVGMPAVFYAGAAIKGSLTEPFPFSPWYAVLPALLPMLLIGPIEELGWRGVALPLLQRRFTPLLSGLLLGLTVAFWHTPSFLLSGTKQSAWAFWPFFLGVVAISVILTPMFNAARGSLLVAFLFHAQMNNPIWPDAQPWDMWLFVAVAVVVAVVNRAAMLDRAAAATAILGQVEPDDAGTGTGPAPSRTRHVRTPQATRPSPAGDVV